MNNYAEWTTKLYKAQSDLGWALRDKQYAEARKLILEIMSCCANLNRYLQGLDK